VAHCDSEVEEKPATSSQVGTQLLYDTKTMLGKVFDSAHMACTQIQGVYRLDWKFTDFFSCFNGKPSGHSLF